MNTKKISIVALVFLLISSFVTAQAPNSFKYQAIVRDAGGNIRSNASVTIRIDILQGSSTGSSLYSESFATSTNAYGLVNLQIGAGSVISGTFSTIAWGSNSNFIKVSVDGTAMGTSQLLSVPYALYAANSAKGNYDSLSNKPTILNNSLKNTATGYQALNSNPTGWSNTAIGYQALYSNASGVDNTAAGLYSLYSNISGYYNTAYGSGSLRYNNTGKGNTSVGCGTLMYNTSGNYNTSMGFHALLHNTIGNNNTSIGYKSLEANTSGNWNIAIGDSSLCSNTTGDKNTAIGYKSLTKSSGWDNTSVGYQTLMANTSGFDNVAIGVDALNINTTGTGNVAVGKNAMNGNISGSNNTAVGMNSSVNSNVSNSSAFGFGAYVDASNKIVVGNTSITSIGGQVAWSTPSDVRLKENVYYNNKLGLSFIMKLRTASYNYKADKNKRHHDGLIAQDVQQAMKDLGINFSGLTIDENEGKTLNLSYAEFVLPLINSVQEQQKTIESQQKQIDELKQLVEKLAEK